MFEEKYDQYGKMLYKIAYLYLGNPADAEDALQEIFIRLLHRGPEFRDGEHEKAWLIRVAANTCKSMLRKQKVRQAQPLEAAGEVGVEDGYDHVLERVLALPEMYKIPIYLHYYEGYPVADIAGILKISPSGAKMRLHRGRELLRLELRE